jgi:hypothetical protein
MSTTIQSTPAAAAGAVFAVLLTLANGQGGPLSDPRDVAATAALTLLIPFAVYVGGLLRAGARTGTDLWLASTATAAGAVGATMKLLSGAPEIARSHAGITTDGQTAEALTGVANAMTLLALFPLALFCLAAGLAGLRSGALPRWLSIGALIAAASLAVNGCFRDTENVPGLLVFALWCLIASLALVSASRRERDTDNTTHSETNATAA